MSLFRLALRGPCPGPFRYLYSPLLPTRTVDDDAMQRAVHRGLQTDCSTARGEPDSRISQSTEASPVSLTTQAKSVCCVTNVSGK